MPPQIQTPPNPATGRPACAAQGACFFCGEYGHFRRNCPKAAGASAQPKLYPLICDTPYVCSSVTDTEVYDLVPVGNEGVIPHVDTEPDFLMEDVCGR